MPILKLLKKEKEPVTLDAWASAISDQLISKFNATIANVERFENSIRNLTEELREKYKEAIGIEMKNMLDRFSSDLNRLSDDAKEQIHQLMESKRKEITQEIELAIRSESEETRKLINQLESAIGKARVAVALLMKKSDSAIEAMNSIEKKLAEMPLRPKPCEGCGRVNLPYAKFCDSCGENLEA